MAEILFDAPVAPDELTNYLNTYVPAPPRNTLTGLARVNYTPDDKVRWGSITRRNRMAKYRAFDGHIHRTSRDMAAESYVNLPPFSNSLMTGEYETLVKEFARMKGGNTALLADAIYNDGELLTQSMWNRVEMGLGQALLGAFTVDENETMFEVDYAVPGDNRITANVLWSDPAALIADDLRALRAQFIASAGVAPGRIVTTERVLGTILRNPQVVAEAIGTQTGRARITRAELTAWLDAESIPVDVTLVEGVMYNDETGLDERVFPDNVLVMTPTVLGDVLQFTFGLSASALKLVRSNRTTLTIDGDGGGIEPRIVGMVIEDGPPYREFTYTDAVGLPILSRPKDVVIGTVLS